MKIYLLIFLFFSINSFAQDFRLKNVFVNCGSSPSCDSIESKITALVGEYRNVAHFNSNLKIFLYSGGFQRFSYRLYNYQSHYYMIAYFDVKTSVESVEVKYSNKKDFPLVTRSLIIRPGDYLEVSELQKSVELLTQQLKDKGYLENKITYEIQRLSSGDQVRLIFNVDLGKPTLLAKILIDSDSQYIKNILDLNIGLYLKKPFDLQLIRQEIDMLREEIFNYGYYLAKYEINQFEKNGQRELKVNFKAGPKFMFDFNTDPGHQLFFDRATLLARIKNLFKKFKRQLTQENIREEIQAYYAKHAFLALEVKTKVKKIVNRDKEPALLYRINIMEGKRWKLGGISAIGNNFLNDNDISLEFRKHATSISKQGYFDPVYHDKFVELLTKKYIEQGFTLAQVKGPASIETEKKFHKKIEYIITEGVRTKISDITFKGVPKALQKILIEELENRVGGFFNPLVFQNDLSLIVTTLKERGYYHAQILNINSNDLLSYSQDASKLQIKLNINLGRQIFLDRVLIIGNVKTKNKIVKRRLSMKSGDMITPSAINQMRDRLSAMGIFSSIIIKPIEESSSDNKTDLLITIKEKDFGSVEIAPGYRTDLGVKVSGKINYSNLWGLNKSITLQAQVNQRLNYSIFDPRRAEEEKKMIEYQTSLIFDQPDIFESYIDHTVSTSINRQRFFSFDADIARISNTISRNFSDVFGLSLSHQYEYISQFDSTEIREQGNRTIGSITPALSFDFRNRPVNPSQGALLTLSYEIANHMFLSQREEDLVIDYTKIVSRNRLYIPITDRLVFASYFAFGYQRNNARDALAAPRGEQKTSGYIPNIKVFRLNGIDIVRGYADDEINRVDDNGQIRDISEVLVDNRAYMTNIKLEPRYYLNDNMAFGVFVDAGRVQVNRFDIGDLRSSGGVTFKYLTAVGTLDFDWGYKFNRRSYQDGGLTFTEDPWRVHVSIGFF